MGIDQCPSGCAITESAIRFQHGILSLCVWPLSIGEAYGLAETIENKMGKTHQGISGR